MKNLILLFSFFTISLSYSQEIKAITEDGKVVVLKTDNTWEYSTAKESNSCNLGEDFKEGKVNKRLLKHVMVDNNCTEKEVVFIESQNNYGSGIYLLCVKGKLMKYKKVGTVFMRDGENPLGN